MSDNVKVVEIAASPNTELNSLVVDEQRNAAEIDFEKKREAARVRTLLRRIITGSTLLALLVLFLKQTKNWMSPDIFFYHPTAMAIACVGLLPELLALAMQAKRAKSINERNETFQTHVLVSTACKIFALVGYAAIFKSKIERGKSHFTTWHGKVGLLAFLTLIVQVSVGIAIFFTSLPVSMNQRMLLKKIHRYAGSLLGGLFGVAFGLGFASNYAQRLFPSGEQWMLALCGSSCGLAVLWALYRE
jgi:hypothetical protein